MSATNTDQHPETPAGSHKDDTASQSTTICKPDQDSTQKASVNDGAYPTGLRFALLLTSVFVSMFLVSLDRLIISTAIPAITDDFKSVTDIGWYGSAYLLTTCAFQLLFGKIYSLFNIKITLITTILLFEIGSAISGAAPNSPVFIVGRAISGIGGAGIMCGVLMVIVHSVPLHKRPMYQGMFGAVFGVASAVGPLLGGAFTSHVTWRWCFYINLPLGAVALIIVFFLLKAPEQPSRKLPLKDKILQLDLFGTAMIVPASVCLILALQWGGTKYSWNDGRMIALLVLAGAFFVVFVLVQVFLPKTATLAPRIFMQRSIFAGAFAALCTGSQQMVYIYYLPIWFQAVRGDSAFLSGIHILPLVMSIVVATILAGYLTRRIGYYTPFIIVGVCFTCVGAGLFDTLQVNTSLANVFGYQVLYGIGMGLSSQAPNLAAQAVLPKHEVSMGTAFIFFSQLLGGAIFLSVAQNIFSNELAERLSHVPGFTPDMIQNTGATSLTKMSASVKPMALVAYNASIKHVLRLGLVIACLTILGALAMEWRSLKNTPAKSEAVVEEKATEPEPSSEARV